jgi:hypothetical protein
LGSGSFAVAVAVAEVLELVAVVKARAMKPLLILSTLLRSSILDANPEGDKHRPDTPEAMVRWVVSDSE